MSLSSQEKPSVEEPSNSQLKDFEKLYITIYQSTSVNEIKKILSIACTICESTEIAKSLAAIITKCDKSKNKPPFERIVECLSREFESDIPLLALELILKLLLKLPSDESQQLWRALEKTNLVNKLHALLNQESKQMKTLLLKYQNMALNRIKCDVVTIYDPHNPIHDELLQRLFNLSEPLNCYNNITLWNGVDIFTLKNLIYFSETYSLYYQRILSEQQQLEENHYSLPTVSVKISQIILDNFPVHDETSESEPKLYDILFADGNAIKELFAMGLVLFDRQWTEKGSSLQVIPDTLEKVKFLFSKHLSNIKVLSELKKALGIEKHLKKTPHPSTASVISLSQKAHKVFSSSALNETSSHIHRVTSASNLSPQEQVTLLMKKFNEYSKELSNPYNENPISSLSSILEITADPNFSWNSVSSELLHLIFASLPEWQRVSQAQTAVLALKFLRRYIKKYTEGCSKLMEALQQPSFVSDDEQPTSIISKYRPLTKMLRHNKTFLPALRLITDMIALAEKSNKITLIADLIQSEILKILSSKLWINDEDAIVQLACFQFQLIDVENEPFDPENPQHQEMISRIWTAAFPHLKLNRLGPDQFEILGFQNIKAIDDFKGRHTLSFKNLCYFTQQYSQFFRVLIGQWVSEPFRASSYFPICDIALRLSDLLIEKFSRGVREKLERKLQKTNRPNKESSNVKMLTSSTNQSRVLESLTTSLATSYSSPTLSVSSSSPRPSLPICPLIFDDIKAFKDIYCITLLAYDTKWLEKTSTNPMMLTPSNSRLFLGATNFTSSNTTSSSPRSQNHGLNVALNILDLLSKNLDSAFEKKPSTLSDFAALMNVQLKIEESSSPSTSLGNAFQKSLSQVEKNVEESNTSPANRTKSDEDLLPRGSTLSSDFVEQYIEAHSEEIRQRGNALAEKALKEVEEKKQKQTNKKKAKSRAATTVGTEPRSMIRRSSTKVIGEKQKRGSSTRKVLQLTGANENEMKGSSPMSEKEKDKKESDKEKQREAIKQREKEIKLQLEQKTIYNKQQLEQDAFLSTILKTPDDKS